MNTDEIIRMAREQGLPETKVKGVFTVNSDDIGRILGYEREACAKLCESLDDASYPTKIVFPSECAKEIRARGNA